MAMFRIPYFTALLLLIGSHSLRADDASNTQTMTLGQVLEIAVRQSQSLQLAHVDVAIADAAVTQSAGVDDWQLSGTLSLQRFKSNSSSLPGNFDSLDGSTSISRSLPSGGVASLTGRSQFDDTPFSITSGQWTQSLTASITQPLLRGRGRRVARAANRKAELNRSALELQQRAAAIVVLRDVITAYWEVAYSATALDIRRGSLRLAEERLRITKASIQAGATARTESLAVEQIIATRKEEIVAAELQQLERSLTLRRIAGLEIGPDHLGITAAAKLSVRPLTFDLRAGLSAAYRNSPELANLAMLKKNATIDVEVTENRLLPRLDGTFSAGPSGVENGFGSALKSMARADGFIVRGALTLEHTLGNRAAVGIARSNRARLTRVKISEADARAQIAIGLARSIASANAAAKRMVLSRRAIDLAEQNVTAEQARFNLGRATNFDIAQRQDELKLAQLRFARASVDYLNSAVLIDSITAELPSKYGIDLQSE